MNVNLKSVLIRKNWIDKEEVKVTISAYFQGLEKIFIDRTNIKIWEMCYTWKKYISGCKQL